MSHWIADGKYIFAYVSTMGEWCSEIATIINNRSVNQLLQYASLGENAESIVDKLLGGNITSEASAISLLKAYVNLTITLTPGDKNPPLERNMLVDSLIEIDRLNDKNEQLEIDNKLIHETMGELGDEVRIYKSMIVTARNEIDRLNEHIKTLESQIKACESLNDLAIAELNLYTDKDAI